MIDRNLKLNILSTRSILGVLQCMLMAGPVTVRCHVCYWAISMDVNATVACPPDEERFV